MTGDFLFNSKLAPVPTKCLLTRSIDCKHITIQTTANFTVPVTMNLKPHIYVELSCTCLGFKTTSN